METVILIGIQGSGKSTFYRERFFDTHVRINLDMLKTPRRESLLLEACLAAKQPFVVDKMNLTRQKRRAYIAKAKAAGFRVVGYVFDSDLDACRKRNEQRAPRQVIPLAGVLAAHRDLELPTRDEGFDEMYRVSIGPEGAFLVEKRVEEA